MKPTVLVLCTGNSCRSHMAEGVLRASAGDLIEVRSAGSKPSGYVHPMAIRVMQEIGIDISGHRSKSMNEFLEGKIETVITVCGNADQACPMFPGQARRYHWGFDDPALARGTEEEVLEKFREVRDQIALVFQAYAAGLKEGIGRLERRRSGDAQKKERAIARRKLMIGCSCHFVLWVLDPPFSKPLKKRATLNRRPFKLRRFLKFPPVTT